MALKYIMMIGALIPWALILTSYSEKVKAIALVAQITSAIALWWMI